jgi:hypothetical protein
MLPTTKRPRLYYKVDDRVVVFGPEQTYWKLRLFVDDEARETINCPDPDLANIFGEGWKAYWEEKIWRHENGMEPITFPWLITQFPHSND